ncbi:hypothetical protein BDQ17DRAFT_1434181 [Cyathus striatus]|nr:hypothetical protein BDQ17DRAFT_1434181 [Cyathus striatus]
MPNQFPPHMPSYLNILRDSILSLTLYQVIKNASNDPSAAKLLIKQLSRNRMICLTIFLGLFGYYTHQGRATATAVSIGAILFTGHLALSFDGIPPELFMNHVKAIGLHTYFIIMLPAFTLQAMLLYEIITLSDSTRLSVVVIFMCYIVTPILVIATLMKGLNAEEEVL